jgi:hypothetical protein
MDSRVLLHWLNGKIVKLVHLKYLNFPSAFREVPHQGQHLAAHLTFDFKLSQLFNKRSENQLVIQDSREGSCVRLGGWHYQSTGEIIKPICHSFQIRRARPLSSSREILSPKIKSNVRSSQGFIGKFRERIYFCSTERTFMHMFRPKPNTSPLLLRLFQP